MSELCSRKNTWRRATENNFGEEYNLMGRDREMPAKAIISKKYTTRRQQKADTLNAMRDPFNA